jgi:hypothetical protein
MNSAVALWRKTGAILLLVLMVLAGGPDLAVAASPDQAPPVPAGLGRIWFLRVLVPGTAMHAPMIYANGTPVAIIPQGTVFYRDFTPGNYVFSVENCLPEPNTSFALMLNAGNQFALQVQQDDEGAWDCEPSQISYISPIAPDMLSYLFNRVRYYGAR